MTKTNEEEKYEQLASRVVSEQVKINADIPHNERHCTIEIQLAPNAEDPIKIEFDLPIDDNSAIEAIQRK